MNKKDLTVAVKRMAYELGADMVGIAPVSRFDGQPHSGLFLTLQGA